MARRVLAVLALVIAGCTAIPASSGTAGSISAAAATQVPAATSTPIATPIRTLPPTPPPAPSLEPLLTDDVDPMLAKAVRTRRSYGLRFDLDYVRAVAVDPLATNWDYSIPMYEWEYQDVFGRFEQSQRLIPIIHAYTTSHLDEFGGMYVDEATHAGVVTLWSGHLLEHAAAIREAVGPDAKVWFGQVRYPMSELDRLEDDVFHGALEPWMDEIPAAVFSSGVNEKLNAVELEVSSANPDAVAIIEAHFDLGHQLVVTSDGTGAELLPRGTVKGKVLAPDGERIPRRVLRALNVDYEWDERVPGSCGDSVGYIPIDGTFEYPCQVGRRTIVIAGPGEGGREVFGRGTVEVEADRTIKVTIRLTKLPKVD